MRILITGVYGFLGYSTAVRLLKAGHTVYGVDKVKEAISPKSARIQNLAKFENFKFHDVNLCNFGQVQTLFGMLDFEHLIHYAAQYSVMHTTDNVLSYVDGNLRAFVHVIEAAKLRGLKRLIYASSTFVQDGMLPNSMYGATKEFNERCAHLYSSQFGIETVGLRFGSVYGPYQRADTGIYYLAKRLYAGLPVDMNRGGFKYQVAFLYVADAVECVVRFIEAKLPQVYNVHTVVAEDRLADLGDLLALAERFSGKTAQRKGEYTPIATRSVPTEVCAKLRAVIGYAPHTKLEEGMEKYCAWFGPRAEQGKV